MKLIVFLALALALVACVAQAQPVAEVALEEVALEEVPHSRQKRARCDLSACNDLCILFKNRGGCCVLGYCTCL